MKHRYSDIQWVTELPGPGALLRHNNTTHTATGELGILGSRHNLTKAAIHLGLSPSGCSERSAPGLQTSTPPPLRVLIHCNVTTHPEHIRLLIQVSQGSTRAVDIHLLQSGLCPSCQLPSCKPPPPSSASRHYLSAPQGPLPLPVDHIPVCSDCQGNDSYNWEYHACGLSLSFTIKLMPLRSILPTTANPTLEPSTVCEPTRALQIR